MKTDRSVTQVGLDSHRTFSSVTARDAEGTIVWRKRLEHADRGPLRRELQTWPKETPVVLEGTFGWGWLSDEPAAASLEPHLASSKKVAAWRDARGLAKSNRTDADLFSELWSQRLIGSEDETLPASGWAMLKGYLQLLDQLRRQIAGVTRELRRQITKTPTGERLRTIPGIDYILGYTILAEVGRIDRFRSARHMASYSLLAPRAYDSGDDDGEAPKGRHVGHAGRRTLKWAWIEAAHGAVRRGGRFREIFDRRTDGGKRDRNRGYITVGHELCRIAYILWKKEVDYSEIPPPRPGRRKRRPGCRRAMNVTPGTSRPGTGQPEHPMVAVPM